MLPDTDAENPDVEDEVTEGSDGSDTDADIDAAGDDEPGEHDEPGGEDDDAGGHEGEARRPAQVEKRGQRDFGKLREDRRAAESRAEAAERRAAELEARLSGRQTDEQRRAEQERVSLMTDREFVEYTRQQDRQEFQRELGALRFQQADTSDRERFERLCEKTPAIAAVADEVERILASERAAGRGGASREIIAKYVIGDRALKNAGRAKGKQTKRAAENKERQTSRPASSRSDVSASGSRRGTESEARRKRLEDVQL